MILASWNALGTVGKTEEGGHMEAEDKYRRPLLFWRSTFHLRSKWSVSLGWSWLWQRLWLWLGVVTTLCECDPTSAQDNNEYNNLSSKFWTAKSTHQNHNSNCNSKSHVFPPHCAIQGTSACPVSEKKEINLRPLKALASMSSCSVLASKLSNTTPRSNTFSEMLSYNMRMEMNLCSLSWLLSHHPTPS